jgi:DNA-binding MarR family transcriptional regulator
VASRVPKRGPFLLLFALDQQLGTLLDTVFADAPLSPPDFAVYSVLRLTGETTPSALAADLGMRRPTVSAHLRRMEARGHVLRRDNPDDGRSAFVRLSASGRRATEACFPAFGSAIEAFRRNLPVEETALVDLLLGAAEALDAAIAELGGAAPSAVAASAGPSPRRGRPRRVG